MIQFRNESDEVEEKVLEAEVSEVEAEVEEELKAEVEAEVEAEAENPEAEAEDPIEAELNSLLDELNEIEESLGIKSDFEDVEFPEFKPIILPPIKIPKPEVPVITKVDFAKLDEEQLEELMKKFRKVEAMESEVKAIKDILEDRLNYDFRAMYDNLMEKTNIEAIKIYRNLQAVVIEENAKQNQALFELDNKTNSLKKRMNNVLIFAIVSFVVSILVMLVTILPAFGIKLF